MTKYLHKNEKVVLTIVQEYLDKNRYFIIEDIVPFINVRVREYSINLNYAGIKKILKSLIEKKYILEGSKLSKEEILNNENRKRIISYISNYPGIHFNQIATELNLSNYILAWHLKMLLKFDFVRCIKIDTHDVFFNSITPSNLERDTIIAFTSKKKVRNLISYLNSHQEGCSKTNISRTLRMHTTTVNKYLNQLENYGILLKKTLSNKTLYFLNERYYYELLSIYKTNK